MNEIVLTGTPYERGRTHGDHYAKRVRQAARALWNSCCNRALTDRIQVTVAHLDILFPEVNEEIRGIADGAGISFEQAFLLNNRALADRVCRDECSHVAVIGPERVLVGMNKDTQDQSIHDFVVAKVRPSNGYDSVGYRHVGKLWGYGINSAGLCAAGTAACPVSTASPTPSVGLYLLGPLLLSRCGSVAQALDLMMEVGAVGENGNVLVADRHDAAVVEFAGTTRLVRRPENGIIASTNFYASGRIAHSSDEQYLNETRDRYHNILRLTSQSEALTVDGMLRILSHHADSGAVCRHQKERDRTVLSFVATPRELQFLIAPGPPCQHAYTTYCVD